MVIQSDHVGGRQSRACFSLHLMTIPFQSARGRTARNTDKANLPPHNCAEAARFPRPPWWGLGAARSAVICLTGKVVKCIAKEWNHMAITKSSPLIPAQAGRGKWKEKAILKAIAACENRADKGGHCFKGFQYVLINWFLCSLDKDQKRNRGCPSQGLRPMFFALPVEAT